MIGNWCLKEIYNGTNSASIQSSTYTSSFSNYYVRFYFQTNTVNSTARIIGNMNDGGANVTVGLSASNDLRLVYQSTITCGSPIVANTTYRIELHENINASTGGYELEVNGVSCGSDFSRNTSTYAPASFTLGSVSAYSSGVIFYYDQLGVGNVTWLGAYTAATMAGGDMSNVDN
jgi:hypothetical protein